MEMLSKTWHVAILCYSRLWRHANSYVDTNASEKQTDKAQDGDSVFIWNDGIYVRVYTASKFQAYDGHSMFLRNAGYRPTSLHGVNIQNIVRPIMYLVLYRTVLIGQLH
jgi:hypothetical protein